LEETLQNKKEAIVAKFYGSSATGRTTFMTNGYVVLTQYAEWCTKTGVNLAMDTAAKAKRFLEVRLQAARDGWKERSLKKHKGRANNAAESAMNAYRQSVCHLSSLSCWQGFGIDMVQTEEIYTVRLSLMAEIKKSKARIQDSAATSSLLTKRLDPEEWKAMLDGMWSGRLDKAFKTAAGKERAQMRSLLCSVLNQAAGRRGGDIRGLDLRMFLWHALPDVKPVPCWTIGASLRTVKEDNILEDHEHLLGWMRAKDRTACPVGALATYLVWLNDVQCTVPFIDVMQKDLQRASPYSADAHDVPKWWSISLINGRKADGSISGSTHTKLTHAAFDSADICGKRSVTHIHRPTALGGLLEGGVVSTDAALYQGWVHGVWADTYAKASFKTLPMLKAHGWDASIDKWECWWEGATDANIPKILLEAVLPGLDDLKKLADKRWAKYHDDRSAVEFIRVLLCLRRVFIEDSAVHQPRYPLFPAYAHPIWKDARIRKTWEEYCSQETARCVMREKEWQLRHHDPGLAFPSLALRRGGVWEPFVPM